MNEPIPHLNESNIEDRMTKKNLKKMKVTTNTNKMHLPFQQINHRNFMIKCVLFEVRVTSQKFVEMHASENKACWMLKGLGLVCWDSFHSYEVEPEYINEKTQVIETIY